jgi:hypothetical protein
LLFSNVHYSHLITSVSWSREYGEWIKTLQSQ